MQIVFKIININIVVNIMILVIIFTDATRLIIRPLFEKEKSVHYYLN